MFDSSIKDRAAPVAFMSYAHNDNHDGRLKVFHEKLRNELRVQLGDKTVDIFMDKGIELGVPWRQRISVGLAESTFLLPIVTPSFLASKECREELLEFIEQERQLERGDLILPIVYLSCREFLISTTDELAASTWKTIESRQFFDWSPFRHKEFSSEEVREAIADLARQIHGRMNQLTSQAGREAASRQPQEHGREVPVQLVLQSLFSRDPVDSRAAAEGIAERGEEAIGAVVEGLHGNAEQTNIILRGLLSRFPEASAPGLLERVEAAGSNWHLATQVPEVFGPPHAPFCEERLRTLLDDPEMDVERKALEALGYLGAVERSPTIFELLKKTVSDSYRYDKIYRYGIEALARIVSLAPMEAAYGGRPRLAFEELEAALKLPLPDGYPTIVSAGLQQILSRCRPHHGDRFVKVWLTSPVKEFRQLGAYALGGIGAGWAITPLLKVASDSDEAPEVRRTATFAIGVIGGAEACRALESLEGEAEFDGVLWSAFCMTVEHARDSKFHELVSILVDRAPAEVCLVYRAIGKRGDEDLIDLVRDGLRSEDGSIRADAALALARLAGADATDDLRRSWAVAASTREKLLVSLALLAVGEELPNDPELMELRRLLADESFLYWSITQRDIVETLRDSSHPASTEIAEAWEPLYESTSSY